MIRLQHLVLCWLITTSLAQTDTTPERGSTASSQTQGAETTQTTTLVTTVTSTPQSLTDGFTTGSAQSTSSNVSSTEPSTSPTARTPSSAYPTQESGSTLGTTSKPESTESTSTTSVPQSTTSTNSTDQTSTITETLPVTTMTTKEGNDSLVSTLGTMSTTLTTPPVAHTTTGVETTTNSTGMPATTQAPESPTTSIHNTTAATESSTITDSFSPTTATSLSTASTTEVDKSSATTTSRYSSTTEPGTAGTTMTPTGTSLTSNTSTVQSSPSSPPGTESSSPTTHPEDTSTTVQTSPPPSTTHSRKCSPDLCPFGSTCVNLFNNYTCQCLPGLYYDSLGNCVDAKVFPGSLHLVRINYTSQMSDKSSKDFKDTAFLISNELRGVLKNTKGYLNSLVLELKQGSVVASIQNIYEPSSDATVSSVKEDITKAIQNTPLFLKAAYTAGNLCQESQSPCDTTSAVCNYLDSGIAKCICRPGFLESPYSNRSCMACLSGYKQDGAQCVKCPFGYAGFNCSDSSLLAVVVISCVLGGLLLIVVLAFIIYCCRKRKGSTYGSPYPAEDFLVWPKQEVPRIPRASTSWDPAPMEMTENGSTRVLVNKHHQGNGATESYDLDAEDLKTFKGKNQSRYSYLCHGQENPYFVADEDKKALK